MPQTSAHVQEVKFNEVLSWGKCFFWFVCFDLFGLGRSFVCFVPFRLVSSLALQSKKVGFGFQLGLAQKKTREKVFTGSRELEGLV